MKSNRLAWVVLVSSAACNSEPQPLPPDNPRVATPAGAVATLTEPLPPVLRWPRKSSVEFGCLLEKAGAKDAKFHCATGKVDAGDPCKNTEAYYAGPQFPSALVTRVHRDLESIKLTWEHAELQSVALTLKGNVAAPEARARLGLPAEGAVHPDNVLNVRVEPDAAATVVTLEGFEHMGAGEVECP